jgi:hypothetical protein
MAVSMGWIGEVPHPVATPVDDDWMLVDRSSGYIFSPEAVLVAEPPMDRFDAMQALDSEDACLDHAGETQRFRALLPGSPGTPFPELEEWSRPPWIIDMFNGVAGWEVWNVVLVRRPGDDEEYEDLVIDQARSYVAGRGEVPIAPAEISDLG